MRRNNDAWQLDLESYVSTHFRVGGSSPIAVLGWIINAHDGRDGGCWMETNSCIGEEE
jgi:hypothetical protein